MATDDNVVPMFEGRRGEYVPPAEPWIRKPELARQFGVSEKTIERWMRDPSYRRGGRHCPFHKPFRNGWVRFRASEVEAWLTLPV